MVAWSWSVLDSFETCAWRHYLTKVTKEVTEPQSQEMAWGNQVHKGLENRVKSGTPLPGNMVQYEPLAAKLYATAWSPGVTFDAEQRMALSSNFQPVSFFAKTGPAVWVRAITDLSIYRGDTALVIDHKTGNPKSETAQLKLTAAVTFHHKPEIQTIHNAYLWLKTGEVTRETYTRADVPAIWQHFMPRVQRLEIAHAENKWPKRPSGLCKNYCPVPHARCEHRGSR